jgi:hypothetical protein
LSIRRQCELLGIVRSVCTASLSHNVDDLPPMRRIDELFTSLCRSAGATRGWFRAWPFRLAANYDDAANRRLHR